MLFSDMQLSALLLRGWRFVKCQHRPYFNKTYLNAKNYKPLKSQYVFELYPTDPCEITGEELITEIYVSIRG